MNQDKTKTSIGRRIDDVLNFVKNFEQKTKQK